MKIRSLGLAGIVIAATAIHAVAHHSVTVINAERKVVVDGSVKEFRRANSPSGIPMTVADAQGQPQQRPVELGGPNRLMRQGRLPRPLPPNVKAGGGQFMAITLPVAFARSATGAIEEFGLFGIWADNCTSGPSPSNQYASVSVTSRGLVQLHSDFEPDYDDMLYRIVDAKRIGQFRLSLRQLLTTDDQVALNDVMLKSNDRIRAWSSRGADGSDYVEDGLLAGKTRQTGWMERSNSRSASELILEREGLGEPPWYLTGQTTNGRFNGLPSELFLTR